MLTALDHVTLTAADFAQAAAFYDAALGALDLTRVAELVDEEESGAEVEAAAWGPWGGSAMIWLIRGPTPTLGLHIQLRAASRAQVETFFAAATTAGGTAHAEPRRWTPYRRGEYAATVSDPAGNLIEVVGAE
ncbi:VOC family protein [uncultured Jatrophihabitans sp.]|uniref:VOC family protein n=1 Tax=uncultured Jatrophihabitans sp. TaxID=1610747 RepID=UPI0035CB062F